MPIQLNVEDGGKLLNVHVRGGRCAQLVGQ